jgi:hypothetical protein
MRDLVSANDLYDTIIFNDPSNYYNQEAPKPYVAIIIGVALSLVTFIYWYKLRWRPHTGTLKNKNGSENPAQRRHEFSVSYITIIATISDNDDPNFTMLRLASQSMLLLGGFQLNFKFTYAVMLIYYSIVSLSDSLRVLTSISDTDSLHNLSKISKRDRGNLKSTLDLTKNSHSPDHVELKGGNVYEDLTKPISVVGLVFITQAILIILVGLDIHQSATHRTIDGTTGVPIVGTLGSYQLYLLGILMQCVYILGPRTNFGASEQNPHYWIKLLLAVKQTGATCSWLDPVDDEQKEFDLRPNDLRIWIPFMMSFLINGFGFHVLAHTLPIQVAAQSTFVSVVIRALGMVYLADLDDAPGNVMKILDLEKNPNNRSSAPDTTLDKKSPKDDDFDSHMKVMKQWTEKTVPRQTEESPQLIIIRSTPEDAFERARFRTEQIQLQKDLDALAGGRMLNLV